MKILDISHYQTKVDWNKIKYPVILKCTEALNYLDPTFKERQKILRDKGMYFGCYHFFRDLDPIKQADFFLANSDWKLGDTLILDFEINVSSTVEKCKLFLDRLKEKTGNTPYFYTNEARVLKYDWSLIKDYPLWVAKYGVNNGQPGTEPKTGVWTEYTIWQYTSKGKIEGIDGYIDLNQLKASPASNSSTVYSQTDSRWKNIKLGFGNYTIGSDGCFLTCLSMMVGKTPDMVNEILKEAKAFSGSLIISDKAAKALGLELLKGNSNIPGKMTNINYMPEWSPSIKEVDYNSKTERTEQHFVLRVIEDGVRYIIDPLEGKKREINYYKFKSYRLFKKT